jgi:hypothetical protein
MYQVHPDTLNNAAARKEKVEELDSSPDVRSEWLTDVVALNEKPRSYVKSGKHATCEREGLEDDVSSIKKRVFQGQKVYGYFCSGLAFRKHWTGAKPKKSKNFEWDGIKGFLIDVADTPFVDGRCPSWMTEISELVSEGVCRQTQLARDRFVGNTESMDKVWEDVGNSQRAIPVKKGKAAQGDDAPIALGVAFTASEDITEFTGVDDEEASSIMSMLWGNSLFEAAEPDSTSAPSCDDAMAAVPPAKRKKASTPDLQKPQVANVAYVNLWSSIDPNGNVFLFDWVFVVMHVVCILCDVCVCVCVRVCVCVFAWLLIRSSLTLRVSRITTHVITQ